MLHKIANETEVYLASATVRIGVKFLTPVNAESHFAPVEGDQLQDRFYFVCDHKNLKKWSDPESPIVSYVEISKERVAILL